MENGLLWDYLLLISQGTMDYTAARYTFNSPLARKLFAVDGVNRVFYGHDHISVGKKDDAEWNVDFLKRIEMFKWNIVDFETRSV